MNRKCSICQKTFKYRQSLWRHKKTCKGDGKHTGDLAGDSKGIDSIKIESQSTGGDNCEDDTKMLEMVELQCKICKKMFTLKKNLLQHQRVVHEKHKKYECGICQKRFSRKSHKEMHIRICSRRVVTRPVGKDIIGNEINGVKKTAKTTGSCTP